MGEEELGPRQRAAETKRRRTREAIVNGTLDLYGEQERGDYTLEQIAEAAGVSAATISNHYPTKYDVLHIAYQRLLSPVIDPITTAFIEHTYDPPDRVAELVRYVHAVAKVSHHHRALTMAMVRAFFETTPERSERFNITDEPAGWIMTGLLAILDGEPFLSGSGRFVRGAFDTGIPAQTALYHANAFLLSLHHSAWPSTPIDVTYDVCSELLCATSPETDLSTLQIHLDQLREKADLQQQIVKTIAGRVFRMVLFGDGRTREWQEDDESDAWGGEWQTYEEDGEPILEVTVSRFTTRFTVEDRGLVGIEKSNRADDGKAEATLQFLDAGLDPVGWMQRVHAWSDR
ncbi:TetR/AcrR family transcriptional regulator [Streptomyces sp. NPDC003300]|uniref:TetR/AcrR family transcriptional regulator n=1 Tax=unclassified Streptomyces TaxID=2593676 RepID=UPI0033A22209